MSSSSAEVLLVRTGAAATLDRASVGGRGTVSSALVKIPRNGPVPVGQLGFEGDVQADLEVHGGPGKAVLVYSDEHYDDWVAELGRDLRGTGLGENLRIRGLTERDVCPGDRIAVGSALFRISAPRRPCYKLALAHGIRDLSVRVQRSGRTGFYLSVDRPGAVCAGDRFEIVERAPHGVTAFEVNRVINLDKRDVDGARRVLTAAADLPPRWVAKLRRRVDGAVESDASDAARLYGNG